MAPPLEISIPTATISSTQKPYTIYNISLRQPLRSYTVQKRYSDFVALHAALTAQADNQPPPATLPQKSWLKSTVSSPELTDARRKGLESYLVAINNASDSRWRKCEAWRQFLHLPASTSAAGANDAAAAALRNSDLQAPVTDPTIWLDTHRELKTHLSQAKQHLRKRDAATSTLAQHEAGAAAKSTLVKSGTVISALERGLQSMSPKDDSTQTQNGLTQESSIPKLGEGEVSRRKNLLSAAKREKETLETALISQTSKIGRSDSEASTPGIEPKDDPIQPLSSRMPPRVASSRRVIGAPVKETEQTRPLDNQGVLQLQQQIMATQEEDVTELTKIVQRMKGMGIQINEELVTQNEMLRALEDDVDRNKTKIDIAKKRVNQIK